MNNGTTNWIGKIKYNMIFKNQDLCSFDISALAIYFLEL